MTDLSVVDPDVRVVEFPCLRARQPIGDIFVATLPYRQVAAMTFFDVRRVLQEDRDVEKYLGIQRQLDPGRVKEIAQYVTTIDASFPSSIIIALEEDYVQYDEKTGRMTVSNVKLGETTPSISLGKVGRVLDGQHRIAGLEDFEGEFDLSVTLFLGADISDQAHIFATVNIEQTKVNKSLVYDLFELARARSPQKTCHNIVVALDRDPESPFYHRIKRLGIATDAEDRIFEPVTQSTLVEGLVDYMSVDPAKDRDILLRGGLPDKVGTDELYKRPLQHLFVNGEDIKIIQLIYNYFSAARARWPDAWASKGKGDMLNRTNGVRALLKFFRVAYTQVAAPGDPVTVQKFLDRVFKGIPLEDADFTTDNFLPGTSGEARLLRILRGKETLH